MTMQSVIDEIAAERRRQVEVEGWTAEHAGEEMALAASCYILSSVGHTDEEATFRWPWNRDWWKPTTPRRDLVKAAAFIIAEIERLDRLAR